MDARNIGHVVFLCAMCALVGQSFLWGDPGEEPCLFDASVHTARGSTRPYKIDYEYLGGEQYPTVLDDVVFLVLTSKAGSSRLSATQSWISKVDPARVYIVSDRNHAETGEVTWPEAEGKKRRVDGSVRIFAAYADWYENNIDFKWTIIVDDDTWVNLDHLAAFLTRFNPAEPLMIGYLWDRVYTESVFISGGTGILTSRPAWEAIAARVFQVPKDDFVAKTATVDPAAMYHLFANGAWAPDTIISGLAWEEGAVFVHSSLFHPFMSNDPYSRNSPEAHGAITFHYAVKHMCNFQTWADMPYRSPQPSVPT